MIIKINKEDLNAIQYSCALGDCLCNVFTIENNDNLLQIEILNVDGSDLRLNHAWELARHFQTKIHATELVNRPIQIKRNYKPSES